MNTKQDGGPKEHKLEPSPYTKHTMTPGTVNTTKVDFYFLRKRHMIDTVMKL